MATFLTQVRNILQNFFLLKEDGFYLLLEDGGRIVIGGNGWVTINHNDSSWTKQTRN